MRLVFAFGLFAAAGMVSAQYASTGLLATSTSIVGWATGVSNLTRGPANVANPGGGNATYGTADAALGAANGSIVSLGDGGSITLTFDKAIRNGKGTDFAVFENGFSTGANAVFAELAFVEVSSDGLNFFRFNAVSNTQTTTQIGGFGSLDPRNVHNLAGQFVSGQGSEFDLQDMTGIAGLDVNSVTHVRMIDVVGSIDPRYGTRDSQGRLINDPYSTPFASGGFDLDAVGVVNAVPEPGTFVVLGLGAALLHRRRR